MYDVQEHENKKNAICNLLSFQTCFFLWKETLLYQCKLELQAGQGLCSPVGQSFADWEL